MDTTVKTISLTDKNGVQVKNDDVLFDGKLHHRYVIDSRNRIYLLSCEGYIHDPSNELISTMKNVGSFKGNEKLMECD